MGRKKRPPVATYVRRARERQDRDRETLPARGYTWRPDEAARVVNILQTYPQCKGEWAGQPFDLEAWQVDDIVAPLFGWYGPDGFRRYRTAYIEIPRKNGKTTLAAGLGLYLLSGDREPGAEIYSAATKRDQAKICHDIASQMAKGSPLYPDPLGVVRLNIHDTELGSKFEPLGADADTMDGLNPHGVIIDEMHAHRDRRVYEVLQTALGARRQPLTVIITTAGVFRPESIGWEMHYHARQVLDGLIEDESFFAYIAAADPEDDWQDPDTWAKANPNLGISVKPRYIEEQAALAASSPAFLNAFLRYHLNIWTQQSTRWIDLEQWRACGGPVDEAALAGATCYGGLDLAATDDLTAWVLYFPDSGAILPRCFVPEENARRLAARHRVTYEAWIRDGFLTATPGNVTDYEFIRAQILADAARFRVVEIGFDPWNALDLAPKLQAEDGLELVEVRQGMASMGPPSKMFDRMLKSGALRHGDHPVLTWAASNAAVVVDVNDNYRPIKNKSMGKIDPLVALIMAIGRATGATDRRSVYEDRGLVTV